MIIIILENLQKQDWLTMRAQIRKKKQNTCHSQSKEQIKSMNSQLRSQIRERQKQAIFSNIRRKFLSQNRNISGQNIGTHQIEQQSIGLDPDQHPLTSRLLQKYSSVPHSQMWKYLGQISQHLIDNNVYLSVLLDQSTHGSCEENQIVQDDQQTLLVNDLFYLTLEHYDRFKFPRKFKFVRNGSRLVASFISMVSTIIMPQQLSYWIRFMSQEDRALVYLGIIGFEDESKNIHLHYQSWVNHPILRNNLLSDIKMESAAKAIREIIGFKQVHPDRLKNNQGFSLYQLLCKLLYEQLQGMREVSEDRSDKCQVTSQHMEICVKVIEAHLLSGLDANQLFRLVDKIMARRVQSQIQLISPLFCIWVIDSLINNNIHVLSKIGYQILVSMISYDPNKLLTINNSGMGIKQEKLRRFYEKLKIDYPTIGSNQQKDSDNDDDDDF